MANNTTLDVKNKVIILLLAFSPIIDIIYTINTIYLNINFPIQQIIRVLIVLYLLISIKDKKYRFIIIALFSLLTIGQIYIIINKYPYNLINNYSYIFKVLNLFCIAFYLKENLDNKSLKLLDLFKGIKVASVILSGNIIISNIFKIGLKTYDYGDRSGYKGFIEAHNDVTVVLLMMLPVLLYNFIKYRKKIDLLIIILNTLALILIGPKAGKILLIFEIIMVLLIYIKDIKVSLKTKKVIGFIFIFLSLFICTNLNNSYIKLTNNVDQKGYDSIYSYIVSYRNIQPRLIDNGLSNEFEVHPKYIFGTGYYYSNSVLNSQKNEFYSIENDFEGLIYYSGIITASIIIFILSLIIYKIIINDKNEKLLKIFILISITIALIHSFLGGHVIYSAISNTYFGSILAIGMYEKSKEGVKKGY